MERFLDPKGNVYTISDVITKISDTIKEFPDESFKIFVGSDSQNKKRRTIFVSSVAIYKVGKGGTFYYTKAWVKKKQSIYERLIKEVGDSIELMELLLKGGIEKVISKDEIEIHIDMGYNGRSREVVETAKGWCQGMGFNFQIKPTAIGATYIANKYTK